MRTMLWRLFCALIQICPDCEQSLREPMTGYVWYFCQTKACLEKLAAPKYIGPERRRTVP